MEQPKIRRVTGADGLTLNLLEWSSDGIPLLFLHGFGNEAHIWDDYAPEVAPSYATIALDHRGHGDSDWDPQCRYGHNDMVRDVEAVTEALGIDRLVVVGHSLGGRIATIFAGRNPERLAGLVLVDIGPSVDTRGTTRIRQDIESRPPGSRRFNDRPSEDFELADSRLALVGRHEQRNHSVVCVACLTCPQSTTDRV